MSKLNFDYVLASTSRLGIWNFYPTLEAAQEAAPAINARETEQYAPMTYAEYKAKERAAYLDEPAREITEAKFYEMLEVLPPMKWITRDGFESFLMSEFMSGPYTHQYVRRGEIRGREDNTFWCKMVDATDPSTWMQP